MEDIMFDARASIEDKKAEAEVLEAPVPSSVPLEPAAGLVEPSSTAFVPAGVDWYSQITGFVKRLVSTGWQNYVAYTTCIDPNTGTVDRLCQQLKLPE